MYINPDVIAYYHHVARALAEGFNPVPYAAFVALIEVIRG